MIVLKLLVLQLFCACALGARIARELADENSIYVGFNLYTKLNPDVPQSLETNNLNSFKSSNFNPLNQIKIIIHGYSENFTNPEHASQMVLKGFQCNGADYNFILIDYQTIYNFFLTDYFTIHANGIPNIVAKKITEFIEFIKTSYSEVTNQKIDLIGFSLGGQISGIVGQSVNGKLNSITALDPAAVSYSDKADEAKLTKDDADYVEIIHTSSLSGITRSTEISGTSDIYVNYLDYQPGCFAIFLTNVVCDHMFAPKLFAHTLCSSEPLMAYECSQDDFYYRKCSDDSTKTKVVVGGDPLTRKTGRYHLVITNKI